MGVWRVGILGAGMIAQGFDEPSSTVVLTMAHAFRADSRFALEGFFDVVARRAEAAETRWQVPPSPRQRDAWLDRGWDVVYVATPDAQHAADLRDLIARAPKAILIEKPVAIDGSDALALLEDARRAGIVVMVDYPRRWHSAVARLRSMADRGDLDVPHTAFVAVSGGAAHNLPHVVDLMHSIWGGGWTVTGVCREGDVQMLRWTRGDASCSMAVAEARDAHYVWEAHFYCAGGKLTFAHSPETVEWAAPAPHPQYGSFNVLTPALGADMEGEPLLPRVVAALAAALDDGACAAAATARELESQRLVAAVLEHF